MSREIRTLWITRRSIDAGYHPPELIEAWDEWSIEENPEGWQEACKHGLDSLGSDLAAHRYINIKVREDALDKAFWPNEIDGEIVG